MDRNQALSGGTAGGVCRDGEGWGVVREKEYHYHCIIKVGLNLFDATQFRADFWGRGCEDYITNIETILIFGDRKSLSLSGAV